MTTTEEPAATPLAGKRRRHHRRRRTGRARSLIDLTVRYPFEQRPSSIDIPERTTHPSLAKGRTATRYEPSCRPRGIGHAPTQNIDFHSRKSFSATSTFVDPRRTTEMPASLRARSTTRMRRNCNFSRIAPPTVPAPPRSSRTGTFADPRRKADQQNRPSDALHRDPKKNINSHVSSRFSLGNDPPTPPSPLPIVPAPPRSFGTATFIDRHCQMEKPTVLRTRIAVKKKLANFSFNFFFLGA